MGKGCITRSRLNKVRRALVDPESEVVRSEVIDDSSFGRGEYLIYTCTTEKLLNPNDTGASSSQRP